MRTLLAAACVMAGAGAATAADFEAIYTNIPFHPTAQVPDGSGEQFRSPLVPFLSLYGSPDGQNWIFKAFTEAVSDNDVIIVGSGTAGAVAAREGNPSPLAGLDFGFMDSDCGINNSGQYAFGNRLAGGSTADDEIIFLFDGVDLVAAAREGDPAPDLFDPDGAGNELFGNALRSAHVLNDGTVAFEADLIQNINTDYRSALYHGATVLVQEGTSAETLAGGDVYDSFALLFHSGPAPGDWVVEADLLIGPDTDEAVSVSSVIEIRDGDMPAGLPMPIATITATGMDGAGNWFARGGISGGDWAVRNGEVIAVTGMPVTPGSEELFAETILHASGNTAGDYIVAGSTSDGREVVVLNGERIVAATDDAVNLAPGTAFVESFTANDLVLSDDLNDDLVDDRLLYAFVTLRDAGFQTVGQGFVVASAADPCPWDCDGSDDGDIGIEDFLAVLSQWGTAGSCDFDGSGDVGIEDFLKILGVWGPCP